jgi:hypothetical protein
MQLSFLGQSKTLSMTMSWDWKYWNKSFIFGPSLGDEKNRIAELKRFMERMKGGGQFPVS